MAKRIRCKCGTIFDPSESGKCPSCGTEIIVAAAPPPEPAPAAIVVEKKSGPPPMPGSENFSSQEGGAKDGSKGQWEGRKRSLLVPIAAAMLVFVAVAAAGTMVAVKYITPVWNQYFGGGGKKDDDDSSNKKKLADAEAKKKAEAEADAKKKAEEKAKEDDKAKTAKIDAEKAEKEKAEKEKAEKEKGKDKSPGGDAKTVVDNDKKEEKKEDKKPEDNSGPGNKGGGNDSGKTADNGGKGMDNNKPSGNDGADKKGPDNSTDKKGTDDKTADNGGTDKKGMDNKTADNGTDKKDNTPPGPGPNPKGDEKEIHLNNTPGAVGMVTLAQAVEKLPEGGTIYLAAGTYPGGIHLTKPIHLVGESQDKDKPVVITFDGGPACLEVESESVFLERLKIEIKKPETAPEPGGKPRRPGIAAIIVQGGAVLSLIDCSIESSGKMGVNVRSSGTLKMNRSKIAGVQGPGILFMGDGTATCTDTTFQDNRIALMTTGKNMVDFKSCVFQGNGPEDGSGSALTLANATQVTADKCTFEHNHCGLLVNGEAILSIQDSTFTENGYTAAPPKEANFFGVIGVVEQGQLRLTGSTFNNNHQGISVMGSGSAEIKDCHFNNTGVKDAEGTFAFYSNPLSISGKDTKVTLLKSSIDKALLGGINIVDGATLTMEDSQVTGCPGSALGAGAPKSAPCTVHVKNCKFNGCEKGLSLTYATTGDIADTECSDNDVGMEAGTAGTKLTVTKLTASGNKTVNLLCVEGAEVTVTDGSLLKSERGAQVGMTNDPAQKAVLTLEKCTLDGNTSDAVVCAASQLNLNSCDFGADGKVVIKKEKTAIVKADPPLPKGSSQLADNDDGVGPSKKDSSSSSGSTTRKGPPPPPRVRRVTPKDAIDQTIDQLGNRLKKIFH